MDQLNNNHTLPEGNKVIVDGNLSDSNGSRDENVRCGLISNGFPGAKAVDEPLQRPKRVAVLGSTGSIGCQTLDVIEEYPGLLSAEVLVAGSKVEELAAQALKFRPKRAVIAREDLGERLRILLEGSGIEALSGEQAVIDSMTLPEVDVVVTATVGYSGLAPTLAAISANKEIALANKETLVVAGELVSRRMATSTSRIIPVDSEHSAIYQCLVGEDPAKVKRLIITASGGPFRTWDKERIENATVEDALHHPNWSMGAKITIDSATMVNKAFEIIEARWLFDIPADRIEAVVHPQSIVHSMVEYVDGSIKAQLGLPDMRGPIRYALAGATRRAAAGPSLSFADMATLTFEAPDPARFPAITLGQLALEKGGLIPCVINAANEIAVASFLKGEIRFPEIFAAIREMVETFTGDVSHPEYADYVACNAVTRRRTREYIDSRLLVPKHFISTPD